MSKGTEEKIQVAQVISSGRMATGPECKNSAGGDGPLGRSGHGFSLWVVGQRAGKGSKRRAPCQLENRCQLQPNRSRVLRA
jgi:hypothetical protein